MSVIQGTPTPLYNVWDTFMKQNLKQAGPDSKVSDDVLQGLHSIHGAILERAVEIVDKCCLTVFSSKCKSREVFQIVGSSGTIYSLFLNINFCQCQAFKYQVLINKTSITCKHVLAAALCYSTNNFKRIEISPEDLTKLLISSFISQEITDLGHNK